MAKCEAAGDFFAVQRKQLADARGIGDPLDHVLDDGYQAVAQRRGPDRSRRWYEQPLVAVGCLLVGVLLVVGYIHTNRGAPEAAKVHDSIVGRVNTATTSTDAPATSAGLR